MGLFDRFSKKPGETPAAKASDAPAAKIVRVSDFLTERNVIFFPAGPSKQQALGSLLGCFDLPDPAVALNAIMAREEAGSTIIAPGLALPHARITGLGKIAAALGLSPSGIMDPHAPNDPIRIFLLFLGPSENMRLHLAFLAAVSSLFQQEGLPEALLQLTTPQAVMDKIRAAEKTLA